jgi:hypothetical protein
MALLVNVRFTGIVEPAATPATPAKTAIPAAAIRPGIFLSRARAPCPEGDEQTGQRQHAAGHREG